MTIATDLKSLPKKLAIFTFLTDLNRPARTFSLRKMQNQYNCLCCEYQSESVSTKNDSKIRESSKKEKHFVDLTNFKSIIDKVKSNLDSYMIPKNQRDDTSTLNL